MKFLLIALIIVVTGCSSGTDAASTHPQSGLETGVPHNTLEIFAAAKLDCDRDALTFEPVGGDVLVQNVSGCENEIQFKYIGDEWLEQE